MKKYLNYISVIFLLLYFISCNEEEDVSYNGKNSIYFSVEGDAVIGETQEEPLIINIELTKSYPEDIELDLILEGNDDDILSLPKKSVKINHSTKKTSFTLISNNKDKLSEDRYVSISLRNLPSHDFELKEALKIRVKPNPKIPQLTDKQKELIAGYKEKYGFDLSDWMGIVFCDVKVESLAGGSPQVFNEAFSKNIKGKTIITLSDLSTPDLPVLKMVDNPLGLTEHLYWMLRKLTIENYEYWNNSGISANLQLMDIINWNEKSTEIFDMTLDNLILRNISSSKADIDFVGKKTNSFGDTYNVIAFDYLFTAWNRQKELLDKGDVGMTEIYGYGASANPETYLFMSNIDNDDWDSPLDYFSPLAQIDFEKGKMSFEFVFDQKDAAGYSHITVNYHRNK